MSTNVNMLRCAAGLCAPLQPHLPGDIAHAIRPRSGGGGVAAIGPGGAGALLSRAPAAAITSHRRCYQRSPRCRRCRRIVVRVLRPCGQRSAWWCGRNRADGAATSSRSPSPLAHMGAGALYFAVYRCISRATCPYGCRPIGQKAPARAKRAASRPRSRSRGRIYGARRQHRTAHLCAP